MCYTLDLMNRREALLSILLCGAGGAGVWWGISSDNSDEAKEIRAKEAQRDSLANGLYAEGKAERGLFVGIILDNDDPRVKELTNLRSQQLVLGRQLYEERGEWLSRLYALKPITLVMGILGVANGLPDLIRSIGSKSTKVEPSSYQVS